MLLATATTLVVAAQAAAPTATGAGAPGSGAAPDTWGPVHVIERNPVGASMVVGPHGVTTVVWGSSKGWPEPVRAVQLMPDGHWREPVGLGVGSRPVVAADAAGNLVAAWSRTRKGFTTGVWAARKPAGKPWSRPVHLSRDKVAPGYPNGGSEYGALDLDVSTGHGGAALVTWRWGNWERDLPYRLHAAYRPPRGRWGPDITLTPRAEAVDAQAAFARNGKAWVVYQLRTAQGPDKLAARSRSASGGWGSAATVGRGSLGDVSVNAHGGVTVVFARNHGVRAAMRPASRTTWLEPVLITPQAARVRAWSVAMNGSGDALVTYRTSAHSVDAVRLRRGGVWTQPRTLVDTDDHLVGLLTAVNARGDMFAGWDNMYGIWGCVRSSRDGWHGVTTAQPDVGGVDVLEATSAAVTPSGDVVLLWEQEARPLRVRVLHVG
jgi:hypothetical protein